MADINIYVSRIGDSKNLSLKQGESLPDEPGDPGNDTLETTVDPSQTIQWSLDSNPDPGRNTTGIAIQSIIKADSTKAKYRNSQQLLIAQPTVTNGVGTGEVVSASNSPGSGKFENYKIGFSIENDLNPDDPNGWWWDDPKLIMR